MSKKTISFCGCNEGYEEIKEKVEKEFKEEVNIKVNKCIGACDKCGWDLISRVDGVLLDGKSTEELYYKIKKEIIK
ncbi:DUF1450 domain-containing protein [Clostridium ihumii]|uniref:DUF1450 domain-containing protein n=1 Tax=Clostridium ihumii TaxID=1470356 RepID=UPI003D32AC56